MELESSEIHSSTSEISSLHRWGELFTRFFFFREYNFTPQALYRQMRARRALLQLKEVPLRTRRALLLYKVYGDSALLVLNGTSLICNNALLALN